MFASSPSDVKRSRPLVLISNLPMDIQRPRFTTGSLSKTVGLPSGSFRVQISFSGLLYNNIRRSLRCLAGVTSFLPSTIILSVSPTRSPMTATLPLTLTLPFPIHTSISRREPNPALARTFCNFSDIMLLCGYESKGITELKAKICQWSLC